MFVVTDGTPVQAIIVCADKGEVLWQIVSVGAAGQPKAVPYGEVPPGFRQEMPREGTPRPFIRNESLEVHVLSQTADMGDGGRATGPNEFLTVVEFSGDRTEDTPFPDCRTPNPAR